MNKLLTYCFCFLLVLAAQVTEAQTIKRFATDSDKYLEQIKLFFSDVKVDGKTKKDLKKFMEVLTIEWNSGKFTPEHKQEIYNTSNLMLDRKMNPQPYFESYLKNLIRFVNSKQSQESFRSWEQGINHLLSIKSGWARNFLVYQEMTESLLDENFIYKSATTSWLASNDNYYFVFDEVPKVIFNGLDIVCYAKRDSLNIKNTKGVYYPMDLQWKGQGGQIDWTRAGFEANQVYAKLSNYEIGMRYSKYEADSVIFYNKKFFVKPLIGKLEDKVLADAHGEMASYPIFRSYDKRLQIKNLFENIDFDGGFLMKGSKIIGSGDEKQNAYIYIYREGERFMRLASQSFMIRNDKISSTDAAATIFYKEDSIYHPSLRFKYFQKLNEVSLTREREGLGFSPFFNSFHKIDMDFESLYWKLGEPMMTLEMTKGVTSESYANFESADYYNEGRYYKIQGLDSQNPLVMLRKCAEKYDSRELTLMHVAQFMVIDPSQVKLFLINLSNLGFLIYNLSEDKIFLKDKLYHYINARAGKTDYDFLLFNSFTQGKHNGSINLLNFDLKLNGVSSVLLSDSQNVYVFPTNQELTMKKNRDFIFDGRVHAGLFDFYGRQFTFYYDQFKLDMPNVDSMAFMVRARKTDARGERPLVKVKGVLEDIKGDLLINHPKNKSGLKPYRQYPIFNSFKDAYVYYDKIKNGVYSRDKFFFHVNPFTIDSLLTFSTDALFFEGTMQTAGIFPDFDEKLKVQEDYSLGFIREAPPDGFPVYSGKGNYFAKIKMSNQGLKGDGRLDYLNSKSNSTQFNFYPDSMNAVVQQFVLEERSTGVEYPPVKTAGVYEQWYPKADNMVISSMNTPIAMFNNDASLHGSMFLRPTGLTGRGKTEFKTAELMSNLFHFKHHVIDADTADFTLKSFDLGDISLKTLNYKSHIDFVNRKGHFKSNGGGSKVEFPVNKYLCYIDEFEWDMDKEQIDLTSSDANPEGADNMSLEELADVELGGTRFVSIHPEQDSLEFFSAKASFSTRKKIIVAKEVLIIKVADANIHPDNKEVTILKDAEMQLLENSRILANRVTKYHTFFEATANIQSRKNYVASGKYHYTDESGQPQEIYFDEISVDTTLQTYAKGKISKTSGFSLSPQFLYTGGVNLNANDEFMVFDGGCQIVQQCDSARSWIKFRERINPQSIFIPVKEPLFDLDSNRLSCAVLLADDSLEIFSAFGKPKGSDSYMEIVSADGFLHFDKISMEYRISNKDKIQELSLPGNFISLTNEGCIVYGEGKMNFGVDLGQIKYDLYGSIKHTMIPDEAELYANIALDFHFTDQATKIIYESLEKNTFLKGLNLNNLNFTKALGEIMGKETADKMVSDISIYGFMKKFPKQLQHQFFFTDLFFKWNPATTSYICEGPIGVLNIEKTQINKYVKGYIEIVKKRNGDVLNIYLEPDEYEWYYFTYKQGVMQAISSSNSFNQIINDTKSKDRTLEVQKGQQPYTYTLGTIRRKEDFKSRFSTN